MASTTAHGVDPVASSAPAQPPPSQSAPPPHPSQRWETAYIYAFICKFTALRKTVEGLESPMDFEQALMFNGSDPIIAAILAAFIQNLRPASRDTSSRVEKLLHNVIEEFCNKENERSVWWSEERRRNLNPLVGTNGFFSQPWDIKLVILRQLVDWQLTHCTRIKDMLDLAWGVKAAKHQKKVDKDANAPPPPEHPESRETLRLDPYGQDSTRKRYWVLDDSPRVYQSGNPWKAVCPYNAISSSREEYTGVLADLKERAPQSGENPEGAKPSKTRSKLEQGHLDLIDKLETQHLPEVDAEIVRAEKARKRFEQKILLAAQAEMRATRTRRQTRRPDYVYDYEEEDELDEAYDTPNDNDFIDDMEIDELDEGGSGAGSSNGGRRRSSRSVVLNSRKSLPGGSHARNGNGAGMGESYRGERRSTRLGNAPVIAFDESEQALLPNSKRARSSLSAGADDVASDIGPSSSARAGSNPAQAASNLVAVPPPAGKKRSKFWYYAVEPAPGANGVAASTPGPDASGSEQLAIAAPPETNGNGYAASFASASAAPSEAGVSLINGMEGVELTEPEIKPDVRPEPSIPYTNGTSTVPANGSAKPVSSASASGSAMEMSIDGS